MSEPIAISVKNVSKNFRLPHQKTSSIKDIFVRPLQAIRGGKSVEVQHALKDISFDVKEGEFFGIVGRNGSGKSTMLKILAEIYQPTSGEISVKGRLVPFIELGVGFNPELTGRENVYLSGALNGFSEKEVDEMYDDIVEFAELGQFMDQQLKNYSSGMQVRLAFSVATRAKADILLIDEVLAVGDADFQRKCFDYFKKLKSNKKTVVFVSHDMEAVRKYCDRAILIDASRLIKDGTADEVATAYSKLFAVSREVKVDNPTSWGDGSADIENINLKEVEGKIKLSFELMASEDARDITYGFSLHDSQGIQILATNNRLNADPKMSLKAGVKSRVAYEFDNVLNDGRYTVDIAVEDESATVVKCWKKEAAVIDIMREKHLPGILNYKIRYIGDSDASE